MFTDKTHTWEDKDTKETLAILKKARNYPAAVDDLALKLDRNEGFYLETEIGEKNLPAFRRAYLKRLVDDYVTVCWELTQTGLSAEEAKELMYVCYGVHDVFTPEKYPELPERRAAFARNRPLLRLVKNSGNIQSIDKNVRKRENEVIDVMVSSIVKQAKTEGIFYGLLKNVHNSLQEKPSGKTTEKELQEYGLTNVPETRFTTEYLKLSGLTREDYLSLSTSSVRKSLVEKYPAENLSEKTILKTAQEDKEAVRNRIIDLLKKDPVYAYMVVKVLCQTEIDPTINFYRAADDPAGSFGHKMVTGRGTVLHEQFSWMRGMVNLVEGLFEKYPQRTVFSCLTDPQLTAGHQNYSKIYEPYVDLMEFFFCGLNFNGVRFARSVQNYRIMPELLVADETCIKYDFNQYSCDWLTFDYMGDGDQIAFSMGFRTDELRFAIFSPYKYRDFYF